MSVWSSHVPLMVGLVVLAATLLAAWWWAVLRLYQLRTPRPTRLTAVAEDGWELAVYFRPGNPRRFREPVLLCHGLAANHYYFDFDPPHSVSHFLSEAGFDCYAVEWRGTGGSRRPPRGKRWRDYCADDHIRFDGPALLALALQHSGAEQAFWLGHSLGGLVGYGVAQGPLGAKLKGLLALGSPVFFPYQSLLKRAVRLVSWASWPLGIRQRLVSAGLAPFVGHIVLPYTDFILNPRHMPARLQRQVLHHVISSISRRMFQQMRDWALNDVLRSWDQRVDYREGIQRLGLPLLVMGGSQDRLATPENIRAQFELAGSGDKTLVIFGPENGDAFHYGHGDLVFGSGAPKEVYPLIERWIVTRATPR